MTNDANLENDFFEPASNNPIASATINLSLVAIQFGGNFLASVATGRAKTVINAYELVTYTLGSCVAGIKQCAERARPMRFVRRRAQIRRVRVRSSG